MASSLLLYGWIARSLSAGAVGEYALIRRSQYLLQPITLLGLTVAVPRYLPFHKDPADQAYISTFGLAVVMGASLIVAVFVLGRLDWVAATLFGGAEERHLAAAFAPLIVSLGLHSYLYSYFRGTMDMRSANRLDLANSALVPLAAMLLFGVHGITAVVMGMAGGMAAISVFLGLPLWKHLGPALRGKPRQGITGSLLAYGLPRIAGDLALAGLVTGPPVLVAHAATMAEVGSFAVAQNLLMVIGAALAPLAIVLLPRVGDRLAAGDLTAVTRGNRLLFHALVDTSAYVLLHLFVFGDVLVRLWVGDELRGATQLVYLAAPAIPFYAQYLVFRSTLDASTAKPLTTLNLFAGFATFALLYFVLRPLALPVAVVTSLALALGYMVVGALTFVAMGRFYGVEGLFDAVTRRIVVLNLVGAGVALGLRVICDPPLWVWVGVALVLAATWLAFLVRWRRDWVMTLLHRGGSSA